jgi:hypothetical protein
MDMRITQVESEQLLKSSLVKRLIPSSSVLLILSDLTPSIPSRFLGKEHYDSAEQTTYFPETEYSPSRTN